MGHIEITPISYHGWKNCIHITNQIVELIIPLDIGPRILKYAFCDGENVLYENEAEFGEIGGDLYRLYGGHRLWHAPQIGLRPNEPDNNPVGYEITEDNRVILTQAPEPISRVQKQMEIALLDETEVSIRHTLTNRNVWNIPVSAWAVTMLRPGGTEVIDWPRICVKDHLPDVQLVFWPGFGPYDSRLTFREDAIVLTHDPQNDGMFKMGVNCGCGSARYSTKDLVFEKHFTWQENATYPDKGVNFETFCNGAYMEMETLSPLVNLEPEQSIHHIEHWTLKRIK